MKVREKEERRASGSRPVREQNEREERRPPDWSCVLCCALQLIERQRRLDCVHSFTRHHRVGRTTQNTAN